jgi:hypothetical protein
LFSEKNIATYNDDMKRAFPEIVAALVIASPLGGGVRSAEKLYELDSKLARLCGEYAEAPDDQRRSDAAKKIGGMHQEIIEAHDAFVKAISEVIAAPVAHLLPTTKAAQSA